MPLHVWGTDHHRGSSELRAKLFFAPEEREKRLRGLLELGFRDLIYVHTCNRVELYTTARDHFADTRSLWLEALRHLGLPEETLFSGYHLEGKSALRHLVRVACALESLVVGEPQILGQLKEALQWTTERGLPVQPTLHRAFQLAFRTAKLVRAETPIGERPVSVASLGLQRVQRLETSYPLQRAVIVGRGPISVIIARWLKANRPEVPVTWVNRSLEKVKELPESEGVELVPLADLLARPPDFTHLFTATSSPVPLFDDEFFARCAPSPKLVLDFAHPPDVSVTVQKPWLEIVPLEGLSTEADANRALRSQAVAQAETHIEDALREFYREQKETPLLRDFSQIEPKVLEDLREAVTLLGDLVPEEMLPRLQKWAHSLVKKNLHSSREHLREILRQAAAGS